MIFRMSHQSVKSTSEIDDLHKIFCCIGALLQTADQPSIVMIDVLK